MGGILNDFGYIYAELDTLKKSLTDDDFLKEARNIIAKREFYANCELAEFLASLDYRLIGCFGLTVRENIDVIVEYLHYDFMAIRHISHAYKDNAAFIFLISDRCGFDFNRLLDVAGDGAKADLRRILEARVREDHDLSRI